METSSSRRGQLPWVLSLRPGEDYSEGRRIDNATGLPTAAPDLGLSPGLKVPVGFEGPSQLRLEFLKMIFKNDGKMGHYRPSIERLFSLPDLFEAELREASGSSASRHHPLLMNAQVEIFV